jgi:hypothetical protein
LILLVVTGVMSCFIFRKMKPLPDKRELDIMWTVATSTSIETGTRPHYGFAKMLYDELNDIKPRVELKK